MLGRISIAFFYALFAFSVLAVATPWNTTPSSSVETVTATVTVTSTAPGSTITTSSGSTCSTGPIQCCNTVEKANTGVVGVILGLLGIVLQDLNVDVGLSCISVVGGTCSAQAVCCEDNSHSLISIGCLPINL